MPLENQVKSNVDLVLGHQRKNVLHLVGGEGNASELVVEVGDDDVLDEALENGAEGWDEDKWANGTGVNPQGKHGNAKLEQDGAAVDTNRTKVNQLNRSVQLEGEQVYQGAGEGWIHARRRVHCLNLEEDIISCD